MPFSKIGKTVLLTAGLISLVALLFLLTLASPEKPQEGSDPVILKATATEPSLITNILVAGRDRASGLYDVMMLLRLNESDGSACVLQIPRDTYAAYTDASYRKLNGAPAKLGFPDLCAFLGHALGVPIDHYVALDLNAFGDAVDAVGGVVITLPEALHYDDPAQGLSIHLEAGSQTLDGKAAEQLVRYRSGYLRGDLGRMDAQKLFLAAFLRRMRAVSLTEAASLAATLLPAVDTDLTLPDILGLYALLPTIADERICFLTLPGEDCVGKRSGASYYVVSAPAAEEAMTRYFGAQAGGFDCDGRFRHATNEDFIAIYESYRPYSVYSAAEIADNGIEIAKTP